MSDFNEILESLNNEQAHAVTTTEGPLLVLAGAGTGKTKVLTTRIAFILAQGLAFPSQILAVTFTNKAAREMEGRIHSMAGDASSGLWIGTFHSICLKIIRKNPELAGLKPDFSIINQDDQLRLIKDIMKQMKVDDKQHNPKMIAGMINSWKDRALNPSDVSDSGDLAAQIYQVYHERCLQMNILDFGDLILKTINIFKENDDILAQYQRRFKYILVDEYQDTNNSQYLWLRLLAMANDNGKQNICCVGDDDQSIYGWRGAQVGNILRFEKDFSGASIIRLETNYRSTADILAAADSLISNNEGRLGKNLVSFKGEGKKVKLVSLWDDRAEANYIADEIESMQQVKKISLDDISILVRAGYQTRAFEECFIKRQIPYKILGGLRFYERLEIRDAIAYIRATFQQDNDLALERIINVPKRGLGSKTIDDLKSFSRAHNISLNKGIRKSLEEQKLKPKIHKILSELFANFDRWRAGFEATETSDKTHIEVVEDIIFESGYKKMWEDEKTIEAKGRLDNLKELSNSLAQFRDIDEFLEHVSLVADAEDAPLGQMVTIMTIHGAKGLEFENVFLPGWEEGLFPSQQSMDELGKEGLEEERRLAYVAITRAKANLTISFTSSRMVFGNIVSSIPSRFIDELPKEHIEAVNNVGGGPGYGVANSSKNSLDESKSGFQIPSRQNGFKSNVLRQKNESKYSVGDRINHDSFGFGRVININGRKLQIIFETAGIKTLVEDFVKPAPKKTG